MNRSSHLNDFVEPEVEHFKIEMAVRVSPRGLREVSGVTTPYMSLLAREVVQLTLMLQRHDSKGQSQHPC